MFEQVFDLGIAVRTRQQGQAGVDRAQLGQGLAGFQRLRDGKDGDAGALGVGFGQHRVGGGAAADGGDAGAMRTLYVVAVVVDHQHRHAAVAQHLRQGAADPAVTDDDGVVVQVQRRARRQLRLLLRGQVFRLPRLPAVEQAEHHRVEHDRHQRAGQHQ